MVGVFWCPQGPGEMNEGDEGDVVGSIYNLYGQSATSSQWVTNPLCLSQTARG